MTGERVLIVDDEESVCAMLTSFCARLGYRASTAQSANEARAALDRETFELIILDLVMPGVPGMEVLRHAKEVQPECEVIILTGYADLQSAVESLRLGAYDYIQKPVDDFDHLGAVISRALERRRLSIRNRLLIEELRLANSELEQRRQRELAYIRQIGQAMASALDAREIIHVLVEAILNATRCDAAGAILLSGQGQQSPFALICGQRGLAPAEVSELAYALLDSLPSDLRPKPQEVEWQGACQQAPVKTDDNARVWQVLQLVCLSSLDALQGMIALASHDATYEASESQSILGILASQGSTALSNSRLFAQTRELAMHDGVTGLVNHRRFFELLEAETSRAGQENEPVAVIMLDLDRQHGLKTINDTLGHLAGDELLRQIGAFLRNQVRQGDIVARYGGDEFAILARRADRDQALAVAQRIRAGLNETTFLVRGVGAHVTASIGVAVWRPHTDDDVDALVSRADRGLYVAKESGGDRVCFEGTTK